MSGKASTKESSHELAFFPTAESLLSDRYYFVTQRPWPSLLFVLPMLIFFEIGTALRHGASPGQDSQLVATYLIDWCIRALGANGAYFPGLVMVVVLMAIHLVGKHPWKFDIYVLPGMLGEALIWTIPLFVFDRVLNTTILSADTELAAETARQTYWIDQIIRSFGAGLYEELVFRLIFITVLAIVLIDLFKLPRASSVIFAMVLSAGLFAAHHIKPFGSEDFQWMAFAFRTAAGVYLGGLLIFRGFGIAAGCHAFYDVIVATIVAVQR